MTRGKVLACAALLLTVAASITLLQPYMTRRWLAMPQMPCSLKSPNDAYQADLRLVSQLGATPSLIQLTGTQETAVEVLNNLRIYRAPVVVTAGRGGPTRRTEDQPFISLDHLTTTTASTTSPLSALSGPVALANSAAAGVEQVLGRRLFPIKIGLFERSSNGGPYAIFDASSGTLLVERSFVSYTWAADRTTISYITSQLAREVFEQAAAALRRAVGGSAAGSGSDVTGTADATYDIFAADADDSDDTDTARSVDGDGDGDEDNVSDGLDWDRQEMAAAVSGATVNNNNAAAVNPNPSGGHNDVTAKAATDVEVSLAQAGATLPHPVRQLLAAASKPVTTLTAAAAGESGTGAAFALQVLAAAVGAALPAAFAAAPPLWFCILCPSVLGLVAPIVINMALNQLAGVLCTQMHLDDNTCFDVILGALGLGFVLSLASAIPIFFVCQLPQCAGRNVTGALRALRWA